MYGIIPSKRRGEPYIPPEDRQNGLFDEFLTLAAQVLGHGRTLEMRRYIQHGDTSCWTHSMAVAYYSFRLAKRLGLRCDYGALVRGALLHDYFLYDWHMPGHHGHGFTHPAAALKNAEADFPLGDKEKDIIASHMFPLTPRPPKSRESLIVCAVDKFCSALEVVRPSPYRRLIRLKSKAV